jgi:hypothetical protein
MFQLMKMEFFVVSHSLICIKHGSKKFALNFEEFLALVYQSPGLKALIMETCCMAGNTQRPESDNKSKIRLLYRGQDVETVGEL